MNKENKKLAQERRAKQRDMQERKKKIMDFLGLWVPVVLIVAVIVVLIVAIATSGGSGSGDDGDDGFSYYDEDGNVVTVSDLSEVGDDDGNDDGDVTLDETDGRVVEDGDTVNIDYVGKVDGVPFEGGDTKGRGADLEIGSGAYIDGFEDAIIGHKVGETFDFTVTFPDPYLNNPEMSGKEAVFTTTINGVYE